MPQIQGVQSVSLIFKTWLENKGLEKISILEQLTYVANRGMGALEFEPATHIPKNTSINLDDIILVLQQVVHQKDNIIAEGLDSRALVNIFKMGIKLIFEISTSLNHFPFIKCYLYNFCRDRT